MGAILDNLKTKKDTPNGPPAEPVAQAEQKEAEKPALQPDTETSWMDFATLSKDFEAEWRKIKAELAAKEHVPKPYARRMVPAAGAPADASIPAGALAFTLMQFNVLADGLSGSRDDVSDRVDPKGFILSPHDSLPWRVRGFAILEEIMRYGKGPDVLCLEEVDQFQFFAHFLEPLGYEGLHKAKDKSPCVKVGKKYGLVLPPDGTAIFWKKEKFELVKAITDFAGMPHEQAVQLVHLRSKERPEQQMLVGVMHLKSKKKAEGELMRVEQLLYLMPQVRKIAEAEGGLPVFFGCDLNAESGRTPIGMEECEYDPFAYQSLVAAETLRKGAEKSPELAKRLAEADPPYEDGFALGFASAYLDGAESKSEPMYTTWKERDSGNAKHTIDYIFYQPKKGVRVTHLLSIPTEEEVNTKTYLPGWEYPSDHFAIQASFVIAPRK